MDEIRSNSHKRLGKGNRQMTNPNEKLTEIARRNVADRYDQPYHKSTIMQGGWDKGSVVRDEIERLLREPMTTDEEGEEA